MALPPSFLDEIRARTPMHALVARRVQLKKSGKNWAGCCPFHSEKSASFYVYEDGFHCFGCGAHGDAITFVMQTQGSTFMDAVESLAAEAGLEVPKQSLRAEEMEQERLGLQDVLEAAQAEFVRMLHTQAGAAGLTYLRNRGLTDATIARFGLGWSGDGRGSLTALLGRQGITPARMEEAGLLRPTEDGGPARELYWGRVTFPIRDRRGRTISFGGRALGDAKPKYINGPETRLFLKKQTLYALDLARDGVRRGPLVVVEGYMDVIALHQAGFAGAVAPLGTALTQEQLAALWRLSPMPILCFDGDAAGARAAARVAELCLPMLTPEQSLRLATLPAGQDPDDLVRRGGAAEFQAVLDAARPLVDALFDVLREGGGETPEARAAFRARLDAAALRIADKGLSQEYRTALRERFFMSRKGSGKGAGRSARLLPGPARPYRTPPAAEAVANERARCLTAILLRHPSLIRDVEEAWSGLELSAPLTRLRDAMLHREDASALDSDALLAHLHSLGLGEDIALVLSPAMPLPPSARSTAMPAEAEGEWWHFFGLMRGLPHMTHEIAQAEQECREKQTRAAFSRLAGLAAARLELTNIDEDSPQD